MVAFDAATESSTFTAASADPFTFNHTPVGTPRGVIVFIVSDESTDVITGVTYGGVAMTRSRFAADTVTETGSCYAYFLGSSIPTGTQTVSIDHDTGSASNRWAVCITMTGVADLAVQNTDIINADTTNASIALDVGNVTAQRYFVNYTGFDAPSSLTLLSGMTAIHDVDFGITSGLVARETGVSAGTTTVGYAATGSEDTAMIVLAIRESGVTATRYYMNLTDHGTQPDQNNGGEWEHERGGNVQTFVTTAGSTALTTTAYAPDAADHLVDGDALHTSFLGPALAAQNIPAQQIKAQVQCLQVHANNNLTLTLKGFIVSNDGSTIKETLFSITRDDFPASEMNTSLQNRGFVTTSSSVDIEDGDRVMVEFGAGGTPASASGVQGHNFSLRFGDSAAGGDLPENESSTGTTLRPWLQFTHFLTEQGAGGSKLFSNVARGVMSGVLRGAR